MNGLESKYLKSIDRSKVGVGIGVVYSFLLISLNINEFRIWIWDDFHHFSLATFEHYYFRFGFINYKRIGFYRFYSFNYFPIPKYIIWIECANRNVHMESDWKGGKTTNRERKINKTKKKKLKLILFRFLVYGFSIIIETFAKNVLFSIKMMPKPRMIRTLWVNVVPLHWKLGFSLYLLRYNMLFIHYYLSKDGRIS